MDKKRLAVITSTRAEYGLLRPVLQKLMASDCLVPELIVTGAHLSDAYGATVQEIETDLQAGAIPPIAARIPILFPGESTAQTVARTLAAFTEYFTASRPSMKLKQAAEQTISRQSGLPEARPREAASSPGQPSANPAPDALLVLGDRYEIFAAASAAALAGIPIAHISGGDVTLGAADDWYRHCITKMAHLHFPSCAVYAQRLVRMGEAPETVHCVGGLGDENIRKLPRLSREELTESTGFDFRPSAGRFGLVTFHPETAPGLPAASSPEDQMRQFLAALDTVGPEQDVRWLLTGSGADAGGAAFNAMAAEWAAARPGRAAFFASLGAKRYLSAMRYAAVVAGNSSSGVVETPSFGVPAVNVGQRQAGRIRCRNIICCGPAQAEAEAALRRALSPEFARVARACVSPYNGGDTSGRIVKTLEQALFAPGFGAPKGFYDGPVPLALAKAAQGQAATV